jgi:hypothetical protein
MRLVLLVLLSSILCYSQGVPRLTPKVSAESISEPAQKRFYRYRDLVDEDTSKLSTADRAILDQGGNETLADPWETQSDACSWYCGGGPSAIASSSSLKPQGSNAYVAKNIHDGTLKTAWVEGKPGLGVGEWVEFTFENKSPRVTSAIIWNGYQKSMSTWRENARVKTLRLIVNGKAMYDLALVDTAGAQRFELGVLGHRPDGKDLVLRFEIKDAYPGTRFSDVALSEINFDGKDVHCFAAGAMVQLDTNRRKAIEDVAVGDTILAYDLPTGAMFADRVLEVGSWTHSDLVRLSLAGTSLTFTRNHPVFVPSKGWCKVVADPSHRLSIGDTVLVLAGSQIRSLPVLGIQDLPESQATYSILKLERGSAFVVDGVVVGLEEHGRKQPSVALAP